MAALGGAATTVAGFLADWSRSSQDADAIQRQLEASITATGANFADYEQRVIAAGEAAVRLGQDDEAASQAISALTQITGNANVALDQMGLVMDLAAAKHLSLENAAELVGKVLQGNTGILARYGIVVEQGATSTEALSQIQQQVAGQAEASATSYGRLREEFSNLTDSIGGAAGGFAPLLGRVVSIPGVLGAEQRRPFGRIVNQIRPGVEVLIHGRPPSATSVYRSSGVGLSPGIQRSSSCPLIIRT